MTYGVNPTQAQYPVFIETMGGQAAQVTISITYGWGAGIWEATWFTNSSTKESRARLEHARIINTTIGVLESYGFKGRREAATSQGISIHDAAHRREVGSNQSYAVLETL